MNNGLRLYKYANEMRVTYSQRRNFC